MQRHFTVTGFVSVDGRTALHRHRLGIWLPPGGHIEPNEDPVQAVLREVDEETRLQVTLLPVSPPFAYRRPTQLHPPVAMAVYDIPRDGSLDEPHQHIDLIYFTRAPRGAALPVDAHDWRWFSPDDLADDEIAEDVRQLGLAAIAALDEAPDV